MPCWYALTSVRFSPLCELARWVLERSGIAYKESCHAPLWNGGATLPVVHAPDAVLNARELLEYLDLRLPDSEKLYPSDSQQRRHVDSLVQSFFDHLAPDVLLYAYANMLPNAAVTTALIADRAPWWEAALLRMLYPAHAWATRKALGITPASVERARQEILATFEAISAGLAKGQLYLVGGRLTAADLAFAAVTAPLLLPPEYGARLPKFSDLPLEMEVTARAAQHTPAGQLALRIYRDHRKPAHDFAPTAPIAVDRSPGDDREDAAIRAVIQPGDFENVRQIARRSAAALIDAARLQGRIDVAGNYSRIVAMRVVAEYVGVPGPTERILMQWLRALFWDAFQNGNNDPLVRRAADNSAAGLRAYLTALIAERKRNPAGDDLLTRLIRAQSLDDDAIRRSITGIAVRAVDTTVIATVQAVDELLRNPDARAQATAAARGGGATDFISAVQIPELIGALLVEPNLRRAKGRYRRVIYEGPLPGRFVVEFGDTR